jgi:hypothetical protein
VLGNDVNDLTLPLYPAATPKHAGRENEPALPLEQGRPNNEVCDSVSSSGVMNRTPLADPGRWRTSTSPPTGTRRPSRVALRSPAGT